MYRTISFEAVSRQGLTHNYDVPKDQTQMTLYPDTLYYDVPETTNTNDVVSQQCYTI